MSYKLFAYGTWFYTDMDDGSFVSDRESTLAIVGEYDPEVIDEFSTEEEAYCAWNEYKTVQIDQYHPLTSDGAFVDVTFYALAECNEDGTTEFLEVSTCNYTKEELIQYD